MSQIAHTPTPWKAVTVNGEPNQSMILDGEGFNHWVAHIQHNGEYMPEKQKANADFIVKAVNSHEDLIWALKTAIEIICDGYDEEPQDLWATSDCQAVNVMKSTLAKHTPVQP